jgi:hypothetical protein
VPSTVSDWRGFGQRGFSNTGIDGELAAASDSGRAGVSERVMGMFTNLLNPAFASFDAYTYLMMILVGVGAAFTMRTIGSLVTATIAALVVFATAVFMRDVVSTGFSVGDAMTLINNDWTALLTLQFGILSVYALATGTVIASCYGLLLLVRQ